MTDFIDILVMRTPHAIKVVLRIAFYFCLFAFILPELTRELFRAVERIFSRLAQRKTLVNLYLFPESTMNSAIC